MLLEDLLAHKATGGMFRLPAYSDHDWKAWDVMHEESGGVRHVVMFCPANKSVMHVSPSDVQAILSAFNL